MRRESAYVVTFATRKVYCELPSHVQYRQRHLWCGHPAYTGCVEFVPAPRVWLSTSTLLNFFTE